MTSSLLAFMAAIQVAAGGNIVWAAPPDPEPAPVAVEAEASAPPLPAWAVEDPYAWERSQCHPVLRGAEPMDHCQVRVRTQLKAALGEKLPAGLQPEGIGSCRQVSNGSGGYTLTCAPEERVMASRDAPAPEVCEERPRAVPGGGVTFERTCRPAGAPTSEGLSFKLFGNRD